MTSAALAAGLRSIDLDDLDADLDPTKTPRRKDDDQTLGGGVTFGSVEGSFHSEEYENEKLGTGLGIGGAEGGRKEKGKGKSDVTADESDSIDYDAGPGAWDQPLKTVRKVKPDTAAPRHQPQQPSRPASSTTAATSLSQAGGTSSRAPSQAATTSTAPTSNDSSPADVQGRRTMPSAVLNLPGNDSVAAEQDDEDASVLLRELNMNSMNASANGKSLNEISSNSLAGGGAMSPPSSPVGHHRRKSSTYLGTAGGIDAKGAKGRGRPRQSLGGNEGGRGKMTLREQEKVIDEVKKENFSLKLKIYFLEERLAKLAPDQIDLALKENIELKVDFQNLRQELKKYKRMLLDQQNLIESLQKESVQVQQGGGKGGSSRERELEKEIKRLRDKEERERVSRDALEARLNEREREVRELRELVKKRSVDEWEGEDARAEIVRLRDELDGVHEAHEDALATNADLRNQIDEVKDILQDREDEMNRLQRQLEERELRSSAGSRARSRISFAGDGDDSEDERSGNMSRSRRPRGEFEKLQRRIGDLEEDNASLRSQINAQLTMLTARNDEKEQLQDEVETLKEEVFHLEAEVEHSRRDNSAGSSALRGLGEGETSAVVEAKEDEINHYRDKLSSAMLELERLEKEKEDMNNELNAMDQEHAEAIARMDEDWKADMEEMKAQHDELAEALEEREHEISALTDKIAELEDLHAEEKEIADALRQQLQDKEAEFLNMGDENANLTNDLKQLAQQVYDLEEELDEKNARIDALEADLKAADREIEEKHDLHEQIVNALKEKLAGSKASLSELTIQHESSKTQAAFLQDKVEELALRTAELEERSRTEAETRRRLEDDRDNLEVALRREEEARDADEQEYRAERRKAEAQWARQLEAREQSLVQAQLEATQAKERIQIREADLERLQDALRAVESERRQLGESASNDRFSLELELDRLKRDLARLEEDLEAAKAEADKAQEALREKELATSMLSSENRDLTTQLASQTQTRLSLTDKLDETAKALRDTQTELAASKDRLQVIEDQLSKDHRELTKTENQYREQLTERNTLLLTIYQYMEKVLGADKTPRKAGQADAKPFTNFALFHDSLLARLKNISQIQLNFDKQAKELEGRFTDQIGSLKKQQDVRLRQLDRFETSIKSATETQRQWRQRVMLKQGELDAAKATNAELQAQISALKSRASIAGTEPGATAKMQALNSRASTAERRLATTQTQLQNAEEKLAEARNKVAVAEGKWEARLRELEARLKAADEKVKRERQGAKERVAELQDAVQHLEKQVGGAERRNVQLGEVVKKAEATKQGTREASKDS